MAAPIRGGADPAPAPAARSPSLPRLVLLYALSIPPLILLPVLIWSLRLPFISNTAGSDYEALELFGFFVSMVIVAAASWRLWRVAHRQAPSSETIVPLVAFALLGCYFAAHTTQFWYPSSDWRLYVRWAEALLRGENPYGVDGVIYPPFAVQALATLYRAVSFAAPLVGAPRNPEFLWNGVLYVYQAMQFFLVLGACGLGYLFGLRCGIRREHCAALIVLLFVFNTPLLRTLRNHQVNLYLLVALLLALLGARRHRMLAGIAVGVASHIKLYPALLLVPSVIRRQFRFALWTVASIAAIFLIQTRWGTDLRLYRGYFEFAATFPYGSAFRDNSVHSVVLNTARAVTAFHVPDAALAGVVRAVVFLISAGIVITMGIRFVARGRLTEGADESRFTADLIDAVAAFVLLSPIVWEHHYVLLIPVAIWAVAEVGRERPWAVGIGTFLMFGLPIFDVYPLSYHRLAGLAVLLWCTHPGRHQRRADTHAPPAGGPGGPDHD